MTPSHTAAGDALYTGNLVQSHNSLYTLFIVLMNVPTEPILCDAIGSNENKVSVVCKKHNNNKLFPKSLCIGVDAWSELLVVFYSEVYYALCCNNASKTILGHFHTLTQYNESWRHDKIVQYQNTS